MAKFVTSLVCMNLDDVYWLLYSPLIYESGEYNNLQLS